ncbi:hypothetical protein Esi_0036_0099 [Ectocarpus siliculosus]|uniref:AP2/ERF domain-containing protein n=1 Tax=Ectocarpus siliculosus TaxID=2880 RepID=D8LLD6_ECTSI|nr:hypothetical protein Esi_0036_0099 [Ectocarpus siliculosus]|eukprot:CBN77134.1 hypothetical protein Esi_0036_0099 [Ectocarpus siliculosus]
MDLMFLADKAEQEASKESKKLQDMQRAPSHSEEARFDSRVGQRRVWMTKNEVALQSRLRYQEAVEALHRVQAEWGPALGLEVSSSKSSCTSSREGSVGMKQDGALPEDYATIGSGAVAGGVTAVRDESRVVKQKRVDTWVVDGAPFPEVNGRYMERGVYGGAPRYRNPNNIFLFRHTLRRSEELGITRQTCLPESELLGEEVESAATTAALSLGREVSGKIGMDFSRLEKVRRNHQRIARAVAKVDAQFQEQMSVASATLNGVDRAEKSGGDAGSGAGAGDRVTSAVGGGAEKSRDLAVMAASDGPKLTFQDNTSDGDRVIPCEEHGVAPLCKRWVARACPKSQIHCRCRHYFISIAEKDRMVAWREGNCAKTELEVLACIAKREGLLSTAEREGVACSRNFLSESRTNVEESDVISLLRLLDQLRLASVRVVEAVCLWREDTQAQRVKSALSSNGNISSEPRTQDGKIPKVNAGKGEPSGALEAEEPTPSSLASSDRRQGGGNNGEYSGVESRCPMDDQCGDLDENSSGNTDLRIKPPKAPVALGSHSERGGGGGGQSAKGRWVATMMVPGRKLWDSSPAMMSQYKRFRRSRQDPKIARDQLYLGVFETKNEAMEAYDDALCREAVKQRSSVLRMPKKRIVTRTCGKHMAIQSDDTPSGRPCEQCAAEALNGGVKHSPPYIWNNSNYLLKMTWDLEFLASVDPLVSWLGAGGGKAFDLKGNPFLLATAGHDDEEEIVEGLGRASLASGEPSAGIGLPRVPSALPLANRTDVVVHPGNSPLPSTAPSSLPAPFSRCLGNNQAEEDLVVAPPPPQQQQHEQQRSWTTPASISHHAGDGDINDDDNTVSARTSCAMSAITTPRAAWADEGHPDLDDVAFGGSSGLDDNRSVASGSAPRSDADGSFQGEREDALATVPEVSAARRPRQAAFGRPTTKVTRFSNGVQEWYGEIAKEGCFIFPFSPAINDNNNLSLSRQQRVPEGVGPGFPPRQETGTSVEVLDMKRVEAALATLHEEEDIADAMSGKPPRERRRIPPATAAAAAEQGGGQGEGVGQSSTAASGKRPERTGSASVAASCGGEDGESATASETRDAQAVTGAGIAADESHQASGGGTVEATSRKRRMRDVLAVYRHRGAQLVLEQSRKRHPFRQDGVFCRQDRGEWAGQRGRVGRMMHKLIEQGQPIHRLAGPRLRVLLAKARGLGGDRLTIDIAEAEAALRLFGRVEKSATVIQAFVRGVFGREASKRFVAMRRREARLKRITMTAAGVVAEEAVGEMLHRSLRRATRIIRRPVTASVGVFQQGRRMIVSACPLEQRDIAGGAPKAATEWRQLCSACQGRSAHRVWSCKRDVEEIFRGVCTCRTVRPPESVRLTAYDPITGEQVQMTVPGKHLTKYLLVKRAFEGADERCVARSGSNNNVDIKNASEAKGLVMAAAKLWPLPWGTVLGYGNPRREAGMVVRSFWEPCHEARKVQQSAENARLDLQQLSEAAVIARRAATEAAAVEESSRAWHEMWQMNAEHVAGRRRDLVLKFLSESEKSREALAFSWRSVQQMENRDTEDWTQAWDPFENGNNWRQLIKRRATDRALTSSLKARLFARDAVYRAREDRAASKHRANEARAKAERAGKALGEGTTLVESLEKKAKEAIDTATRALKLLTILSRPTVKAAGRLQKRLVIEEGGHDREQWDALFRGGMVLETPELSYVSVIESKRKFCVATIRRDARTGTVRVTAAGDDKAVDLFSVTMSAAEVMSVVSEKVGGRRGKELVAPIVMEGGYAAIGRVQEARRKEILQVFVESLKLDIYQHELAIGKLFLIRRSAELKSRLLESLWHQDAVIGRSSGRGTEIFRQFRRLGTGWAAVAVYETWGDLFFEAYDPTTTSTMTLETSVREVLGSLLPSDRAAAAAYLLAVRTGTFPRKLMRQVLNRLDVILPGESGRWWRRPIDGEMPHLALISTEAPHSTASNGRNACQQYRGPVWTEERFSSGKAVTARVLVSARGDYLVEMEARDAKKQKRRLGSGSEEDTGRAAKHGQSHAPSRPPSCLATSDRGVLRLEVKDQELRSVLRAVDRERRQQQPEEGPERKDMENLLAPDRRAELCRYLLDHIALEDVRPSTTAPASNDDTPSKGLEVVAAGNVGIEVELRAAYKSYKAWAAAINAPVDRDPLRGTLQQQHSPELSPSDFVLVLRPDIDSDEHLLPIHESPWTPDGKTWFQAKVSLLQGAPAASAPVAAVTAVGPRGSHTNGERGRGAGLLPLGRNHTCSSVGEGSKPLKNEELGEKSGGLSVTLRPEGAGQRRARLEREAIAAMAHEDQRSRLVGRGVSRLDKEAAGRAAAVEEARRSSRLAAAVFTTRTRNQNRVEALLRQEQAQAKIWAEQDLVSARQAAGEMLPLLRLETRPNEGGEQGALPLLQMMDATTSNDDNRGRKGASTLRRFHVLDGAEEPTTTATPVAKRSLAKTKLGRSFVLQRGREVVAPPGEAKGGTGTAVGRTRDEEVLPAPLRGVCVSRLPEGLEKGLVPSERRYRGEGFLERHGARSGSGSGSASFACYAGVMQRRPNGDSRPTPLVQQVLRLERGCGRVDDKNRNGSSAGTTTVTTRATSVVAVVRAVLEPAAANTCDCDGTAGHEQDDRDAGRCEVRTVIRVEAYLPDSSTTVALHVKVPPSPSTSPKTTVEGDGTLPTEVHKNEGGEDQATLPLRINVATSSCIKGGAPVAADTECKERRESLYVDAEHKQECRLRKKRRRACRDARYAEARRGDAEMFAVVQEAIGDASKRTSSHTRSQKGGMDTFEETPNTNEGLYNPPDGEGHQRHKHNNAFSMLLVRANVVVPVRRLHLGSGSWRETIGKLVGCPAGQELRALNVNGPLVYALDSSCPAPFNVKAEKLFGIRVGEAKNVEQRRRRGNEAVNKEARRLLPALSRSFFSASFNPDDAAAAEVRALFDKAWLTRVSEMFDDPAKELDACSGLYDPGAGVSCAVLPPESGKSLC